MYKKKVVNGVLPLIEENLETLQLDLLSLVTDYSPIVERKPEKKTRTSEKVFGFQYFGIVDKTKTFSNFYEASSNFEALFTIKNFLDHHGFATNCIYLSSSSGLGKSHLLHAVSNILLERKQAFYLTSAILLNSYSDSLHIFNQYKYILIDDVEDLESGGSGEKVLCHLLDLAAKKLCKVIVTGSKDRNALMKEESRLTKKLLGALHLEMKSMDRELVQKYIEEKSQALNIDLNEDQIKVIISRSMQNAHAIDGAILKFKNLNELNLQNVYKLNDDNQTSLIDYEQAVIEKLINDVANEFAISRKDIFSNKRDKDFILPRHVAMYLLKDRLGLSLNQIGKIFSKDHTTVIYAVEKVKKSLKTNSLIEQRVNKIPL